MAEEWTPFDGLGAGKPKGASSEKTGPFVASGGGGQQPQRMGAGGRPGQRGGTKGTEGTKGTKGTKGTVGTNGTVRTEGVLSRDAYVAGLVRNAPPERHREVLQREEQRLTAAAVEHERKIRERRAAGAAEASPQIQGRWALTRGTDEAFRRNGGKPVEGTLQDRILRIRSALGGPLWEPSRPASRPVSRPASGAQPQGGSAPLRKPAQPPQPLVLDGDVSAAPTDYVQRVLQGVAPGGQAARLRWELEQVTGETARLQGKIDELRAKNVPTEDPRIQVLQRRIRGTDVEVRRRDGVPARESLEDRADQLRVALEPPRAGEQRRQTRREERRMDLQAPRPTPVQEWASGLGPGLQHAAGVKFSMMEAGRQADLASAKKVEQEADAAAKLPRPGTRGFKELAPAAAVMDRFFPSDKRYPAAEVDRIMASPEFQRARKGVTPQTLQYLDQMGARLRARNGRSADANEGTAEAAGLIADVAGDKLFGLAGEWLRGLSRAKAVAKYGAETVAEAEKRGLLASIRAGGKTLAQDTRIRARLGAAPGAATMAGYNVLNEVVAGDPKRPPLKAAKDVLRAGATGALEGAAGSVVSETLAPLRGKGGAAAVRAGQEVARGGLNFGVVEPLGALLEGERDPKKLLDRFLGGLLFGAALHAPQAGKELFTKPRAEAGPRAEGGKPEAPELQPGDRVRVAAKPELGTATVREVVGGHAVLRLDEKQGGISTVKARTGEVEHLGGATEAASGTATGRPGRSPEQGPVKAGDIVRVPSKPELGAARVREVTGGFAVLRPENKPRGAGVVKVRVEHVAPTAGVVMATAPSRGARPKEVAFTPEATKKSPIVQVSSEAGGRLWPEVLGLLERGVTEKQLLSRLGERGYHPELVQSVLRQLQREGRISVRGSGKSALYENATSRTPRGVAGYLGDPMSLGARAGSGDQMSASRGGPGASKWSERPKLPGDPNGLLLGGLLNIPDEVKYDPIRQAIASIDQVHGLGSANPSSLPIVLDPALPEHTWGLFEMDGLGNPLGIRLRPNEYSGSTLLHEIGHFLDRVVLGNPGVYASTTRHPDTSPILDELYKSSAATELRQLARDRFVVDDRVVEGNARRPVDLARIGYLLRPHELWARAYAQYLALHSGEPQLQAGIDYFRASRPGNIYRATQWTDDDFAPIAGRFDELMRRHHWRK